MVLRPCGVAGRTTRRRAGLGVCCSFTLSREAEDFIGIEARRDDALAAELGRLRLQACVLGDRLRQQTLAGDLTVLSWWHLRHEGGEIGLLLLRGPGRGHGVELEGLVFGENSARLYKFQRSGELSEPRGSPTIGVTAGQAGALAPLVRVAPDQPEPLSSSSSARTAAVKANIRSSNVDIRAPSCSSCEPIRLSQKTAMSPSQT